MMPYNDKFKATDELIVSMQSMLSNVDAQTQAKFTGFLSVSAVTVYELAIKEIIISYACSKHSDFGCFITKYLSRLNGKIKLEDLKNEIKKYGDIYKSKFETELEVAGSLILKNERQDLKSCYNNLILCRHEYVHGGNVTLSMQECINNYIIGKKVIEALYITMQ
jgi:hypothetical protein